MKVILILIMGILLMGSCKTKSDVFVQNDASDVSEWNYLLDETSIKSWRAFRGEKLPDQWSIKNSTLAFVPDHENDSGNGGRNSIVYGNEEYENFELYIEWKLSEGGSSGIFYHINEKYWISDVAPEYQLVDDLGWERINKMKLKEVQKTGADYAMHSPDRSVKIVMPAGEWNTSRIIFTTDHAEHWLNGNKILEFVPWSADWKKRKQSGKWKDHPEYGIYTKGYIGLQAHDTPIWFKNIKIRKL
jgi:hypothetical protein